MQRQRINAQHINVGAIIVASERRWVMSQKLAVVVTGGTGKQGSAVVKSLLKRGHEVRAVTRSTDSAKARELVNAGVTLVRASLEDTAALTRPSRRCVPPSDGVVIAKREVAPSRECRRPTRILPQQAGEAM